jgi:outer membrane putative beta-barrel porin/alpha-amylase
MRRLLLGCALVLMAAGAGAAADDDTIDPDRPDVSVGAKTVGAGRVQLEAGVLFERTRLAGEPTERRLSAEALVRIGVARALELRIEGEPIVRLRGAEDATDVGDFTLGAKWRFFDPAEDSHWPALALLPFVTLPTAPAPIGTEKPDYGVLLAASFELPADFALDVAAGMAALGQTQPSGYLLQALVSASLSRKLGRGLAAFGEVFYGSREEWTERDRVGIDGGVVWTVLPNLALDVAVGTSLYGRVPDVFVRAGGSVRFGR